MPSLSPLSSLASTESIEVYFPSYQCQSAAIFTATLFYRRLFQRPCKNLRLSYHYMLITRRRRLSYRSSQLTNDHDFLWKAPVAQNVSQPMSCLNRWQRIGQGYAHNDHINSYWPYFWRWKCTSAYNFQYQSRLSSKWPYCHVTSFFLA